jgi:N-formylglutamate amidohydrolase
MVLASPVVHRPRGALPVLLSVPHAGRDYPDWLSSLASGGCESLTSLEDPLVDRLVWRAVGRGIGAVIATAPRAGIDCNRSEEDVDPSVISGVRPRRVSARARGGLGVVPGRTQQHGFLWRRPISVPELDARLRSAHRPYHAALGEQLDQLRERFGCALLLDCHSMPPPPNGVAPIIIGDCHGQSAAAWLSSEAVRISRAAGFDAGLNDPFAGGYVIERHGRPVHNIHALQIEVDRRLYLDGALKQPGEGFDAVTRLLETLATRLGEMLLDRHQLATAAE